MHPSSFDVQSCGRNIFQEMPVLHVAIVITSHRINIGTCRLWNLRNNCLAVSILVVPTHDLPRVNSRGVGMGIFQEIHLFFRANYLKDVDQLLVHP